MNEQIFPLMDFAITNITMPVAALLASLIGATATLTAALLQLRMAWRKELKARERGQPVTKQAKRGPVMSVAVLSLASAVGGAVGGYALAQYLPLGQKTATEQLRDEFNARLAQLSSSVERMERRQVNGAAAPMDAAPTTPASAAVTATLPPCGACSEDSAQQVDLCASIPAAASVEAVELYTRAGDGTADWSGQRVAAEQVQAAGRFSGTPRERLESDSRKQVCQTFLHWNADEARSVRLVVNYRSNGGH